MKAGELDGEVGEWTRRELAAVAARVARQRDVPFIDEGRGARARLLVGLQYDRGAGDAPLLRCLLEAEIRAEEETQGASMLDLAAFLLARFRDPDDLGRFARAKLASFDAACGFDREYLLSAGIEPAMAALAALDEPLRARAAEVMLAGGESAFSAEDLAVWWDGKQRYFAARWQDEEVAWLVDLALDWDERAWASALLDRLERARVGDPTFLGTLAFYRRGLGEHRAAAAAQRELAARATDPSDRARHLQALAAELLAAGQAEEAAVELVRAIAPTREDGHWHRIGLGRALVSQGFAIAAALPRGEAATQLVRTCDGLARELARTTLELLERAAVAAERHGLNELAAHYAAEAAAERRRIAG